jgi:hypothetical protein
MKSVEDGSGLSFPNKALCTSTAKSDPQPCSSHMASPSPVYYHTGQTLDWRGAMHLDRKSDSTTIEDRP